LFDLGTAFSGKHSNTTNVSFSRHSAMHEAFHEDKPFPQSASFVIPNCHCHNTGPFPLAYFNFQLAKESLVIMFEAVLTEGKTFKHIIEAIKDLVGDCNLDCSEEDISIQSMDSAHVSLVAVRLGSEAFSSYRCDRPNSLGISTNSMDKILKMLGDKDNITFKAEDDKPDTLTMLFESEQDNGPIADFGKSSGTNAKWFCFTPACLFISVSGNTVRLEAHGNRT
jgi:hypothetical protein